MIETLRALVVVSVMAFRVSKLQTLLGFSETLGRSLDALKPVFYGLFAAGAVTGNVRSLIIAVVGLTVATGISEALQFVGVSARLKQQTYVGFAFSREVSELMASIETLDHHENPELLDKVETFRSWSASIGGALNALMNMINTLAFSVTTVIVALTADWRLLILAVLGIPRLLLVGVSARWDKAAEEEGAPHSRQADRLVDLTRDVDAGAEARVFDLRSVLLDRIGAAAYRWQLPDRRRSDKQALLELANGLLYFGGAAVIIGWMVNDAIAGSVGVGALTIAVTSISSLQNISSGIVNTIKWLGESSRSAVRFLWLRDYAAEVHRRYAGEQQPPAQLTDGIRLEGLRFRYPGAESDSLGTVDLELPAGSVVAVVGENGAGKSTLVKLLTGMYQPTEGRVLIDGVDLADIDLTAWRTRVSAAFQDHANFELPAVWSIGLGKVDEVDDEAAVHRALENAAASDLMTALPSGLQTQLGAGWPEGVDLSGGQWQRVAIARGMMRTRPLLLALDEPTSALDAATEHALFDRYAAAARTAGGRGAVTLLVTHRFSTVAAADIVLVLDQGRIVQRGTHAELMATDGIYASLYEIQARGYR